MCCHFLPKCVWLCAGDVVWGKPIHYGNIKGLIVICFSPHLYRHTHTCACRHTYHKLSSVLSIWLQKALTLQDIILRAWAHLVLTTSEIQELTHMQTLTCTNNTNICTVTITYTYTQQTPVESVKTFHSGRTIMKKFEGWQWEAYRERKKERQHNRNSNKMMLYFSRRVY